MTNEGYSVDNEGRACSNGAEDGEGSHTAIDRYDQITGALAKAYVKSLIAGATNKGSAGRDALAFLLDFCPCGREWKDCEFFQGDNNAANG